MVPLHSAWAVRAKFHLKQKRETENQTLHVLTHKWELNSENTWTQGGDHHTPGPIGGWVARRGIAGVGGDRERIVIGEIPNVDDGVMDAANHHGACIAV